MRLLLTSLLTILLISTAWAGVTGEIVGKTIDSNGNIVIRTQYKIDGVEVPSQYPKDAQGRYYWQTRYNFENFDGMTDEQIFARIEQDIEDFAKLLITDKYVRAENSKINLDSLIGRSVETNSATIKLSPIKTITVTTGGLSAVEITEPPPAMKTIEEQIDEVKSAIAEVKAAVDKVDCGLEAIKP